MGFNEEMKKVLLAGVGAVATSLEKSSEIVDKLVKKGELTVEQGKVLNEELKRNVKDSWEKAGSQQKQPEILDQLEELSEDELTALRLKLAEMEAMERMEKVNEEENENKISPA